MESELPKIILTRPRQQGEDFAAALRAASDQDLRIEIAPMVEIEAIDFALKQVPKHLIFTSGFALRIFAAQEDWRGPVTVVGEQVARHARDLGFDVVACFATVAGLIAAGLPEGASYIRGELVSEDLLGSEQFVVYRQKPLAWRGDTQAKGLIMPVFSTQSAMRFSKSLDFDVAEQNWIAISQQVAQALKSIGALRIEVAKTPDRQGMIAAVLNQF